MVSITTIQHPERFTTGVRVLLLKSRYKDGVDKQRMRVEISHNSEEFAKRLQILHEMMAPNERIYVSAGARDLSRAVHSFKEKQLLAEFGGDVAFYKNVQTRWVSALMQPNAQSEKLWLFDCDDRDASLRLIEEIDVLYPRDNPVPVYVYPSKNGTHIITAPFDKRGLSGPTEKCRHANPIMLWSYS